MGSNQRVPHVGAPQAVIEQAITALETAECDVFAASPIVHSRPLGPSRRAYANAAAILASDLTPPAMLAMLQSVEAHFGRRRRGQRWQARTLDLDIILWSGGLWCSDDPQLAIPHPEMHRRAFVLGPAMAICPDWREPMTGRSIRQLFHCHNRAKPLDRLQKRL